MNGALPSDPVAVPYASAPPAAGAETGSSFSFRELLSELNPLQHIPIIGAIYRAVTGDVIPETARTIGSLVFGGLTGGPIGLATSAALLGLERVLGIDREQIGQQVLANLGIGHGADAAADAAPGGTMLEVGSAAPAEPLPVQAWSPAQLRAYGISTSSTGTLVRGTVAGSDVLNDLVIAGFARGRGLQEAPAIVMTA